MVVLQQVHNLIWPVIKGKQTRELTALNDRIIHAVTTEHHIKVLRRWLELLELLTSRIILRIIIKQLFKALLWLRRKACNDN